MQSPGGFAPRGCGIAFPIVMPRFRRGIQYAETSRQARTVSGILDRAVKPGDDVGKSTLF